MSPYLLYYNNKIVKVSFLITYYRSEYIEMCIDNNYSDIKGEVNYV